MSYPDHIAKLAQAACADKRTRQGGWGAIADALMTIEKSRVALADLLVQLEAVGIYIPGEDSGQWAGPF